MPGFDVGGSLFWIVASLSGTPDSPVSTPARKTADRIAS
ncbi:hypothetical protein RERY_07330 [Rhodococcus erythropolis]|nr:hypothetical protein RERY_07330 [Rhodococcus erythropolis]